MKKFFATTLAMCALSTAAFAADSDNKLQAEQAYAHPTLFKSQAYVLEDGVANSAYVTGGKIVRSKDSALKDKKNVFVNSWAKDQKNEMQDRQEKAGYTNDFNPNAPTLRSEVAFLFAHGLNLTTPSTYKAYSDISASYWDKDEIYAVLDKGVMIGYPSGVFKPDQQITKAEVFAVIAQLIKVNHSETATPQYKKQVVAYIPKWAYSAANEVIASNLLDYVPDSKAIIENEYLTKEQVTYLVGALRENWDKLKDGSALKNINVNADSSSCCVSQVKVKLLDRLSARHSNIGDWFTAKTTESVTVDGHTFAEGSIVRGEVVAVQRPGVHEEGFIKVAFKYIKDDSTQKDIPNKIAKASVSDLHNPNFFARLLGAPLTISGRTVGVVGRSGAAIANVTGNGLEKVGDELSNTLVETLTLHPGRGMASFGQSVVTVFKGTFDIVKTCVSGTFGILYEVGDELLYVFIPKYGNSSSLNPNEEITIYF